MNLTNNADKDIWKRAASEFSNSLVRQDAERDLQKGIVDRVHDTIGIEKKIIRKAMKIQHKANMDEVNAEHDEVMTLLETANGTE